MDWKSNYLGDTLEDYAHDKLNDAMNENNYHLQYLIYTLAAKKYLTTRIKDFEYEKHFGGVMYLFLRGVRKDTSYGVFLKRPTEDSIGKLENILKY